MTQEDKELLFKDLCGRVPYGVIVNACMGKSFHPVTDKLSAVELDSDGHMNVTLKDDDDYFMWRISEVKPYLRPMSSMTEIEKEEYDKFFTTITAKEANFGKWISPADDIALIDWYNKHHFDYRGLIPMGLALEAPEGMYDEKETKQD